MDRAKKKSLIVSAGMVFLVGVAMGCGDDDNGDNANNNGAQEPNGDDPVVLIRPDSATASSEWSSGYLIEYVIDGSGLPDDFGPDDAHADYVSGNHWTTTDGDVEGAWARFEFDQAVTLDTFWMWNHRSTSPPAYSTNYAVTRFDLEFFDGDDQSLQEVTDLQANPGVTTAQEISFGEVQDVRAVVFTVRENAGEPDVTGLAEVAFSGAN